MDAVNISVVENVETVTISVVTGFATVVNSDATYTKQAPVDATTVLPDVEHTDTGGDKVTLPAMTPMVCTPTVGADVENSDDTYSQHVNDGATLVLPDTIVKNTAGTTILVQPSATSTGVIADSVVTNSNATYLFPLPATQTHVVPDSEIRNENGNTLGTAPATQPFVVPNMSIENSDGSYVQSVAIGFGVILPDTIVKNTAGTTILVQPSATNTGVIADSVVTNSDDSFVVNVPAEEPLELADITNIDTDGTPVVLPAMTPFTCTPPVYKWYGIEYDITATSPDVTRIATFGDMDLHVSLPIQSMMRACLLLDNGTVNYWLDPNDWSKKIDGTASNLDGTDGQVMIYVPRHYRKFETSGNIYRCKLSMYPIAGFHEVPAFYIGAYEASLYRPTLKLSSVVNATADYRGGNNNAAWDAQANTLLGKPATVINRTNFRTYARNRAAGTNWNINTYEQHKAITWLFVVEYATRYSQKAVDNTFTAEGYRKGGLGDGVTTANSTEWSTFNSYYPFINCGASNTLATKSGEVSVAVTDFGGAGVPRSFTVNRYRGIEMPFGHVWKFLDGANVDVRTVAAGDFSKMWVTNDPAYFNDVNYTNYSDRGLTARADGYVKTIIGGQYGEIVPNVGGTAGGNYNIFWTDYHYQSIATSQLRTLLVGGHALYGTSAGLVYVCSSYSPAHTHSAFGSRLCFIP